MPKAANYEFSADEERAMRQYAREKRAVSKQNQILPQQPSAIAMGRIPGEIPPVVG
jgi:hypothetical protein